MREIKFRAWDKKTQRMLSPEYTETVMALMGWSGGEDYIYMQYTGLHDKNGKEIYEGDIVNNSLGNPAIVMYGIGIADNPPNYCGFIMRCHLGTNSLFEWYGGNVEVIGNVHQHPELLEKTG